MKLRTVKLIVAATGIVCSSLAWAGGDGRSLDSFDHHSGSFRFHRDGDGHQGWQGGGGWGGNGGGHVPSVPEPSEWMMLGVGLALLAGVAYRRQSKS